MNYRWCLTGIAIALCTPCPETLAGVDGEARPLFTQSASPTLPLSFSIGTETVATHVEYEPHLDGGGFAPVRQMLRHRSDRLGLSWSPSDRIDLYANWASHTIVSKRDQFELDSYQLSARYQLTSSTGPWEFALGASFGANRAESLSKTSFTNIGDYLVTRASIYSPGDRHLQTNLFARRSFASGLNSVLYAGIGQAVSVNKGLDGVLLDTDRCRFGFSLNERSSSVYLVEPCGVVQSYRRQYASRSAFEQQFDFDVKDDIRGKTRYWQTGGQLSTQQGKSYWGLGLHYQRFFRDSIDERLTGRGEQPLLDNHTLSAWWHYQVSPRWQLEAGAEYSRRPLLNSLFVLYTSLTSERFRQSAVLFSLNLRYRFGPQTRRLPATTTLLEKTPQRVLAQQPVTGP